MDTTKVKDVFEKAEKIESVKHIIEDWDNALRTTEFDKKLAIKWMFDEIVKLGELKKS